MHCPHVSNDKLEVRMATLENMTAIVTGASSGIGKAIALRR
jgi:hypothetical protein